MKLRQRLVWSVMLSALCQSASADSDTKSVQAEFDRCRAIMERLERLLRRYEDAVEAIKRNVAKPDSSVNEAVTKEAAALENRLEYFRNRFERSRGQADKIHGELKNVKGPVCPSCIESSVNMYCRNAETMQNDIDEYLLKANELQSRLGVSGKAELLKAADGSGPDSSFESRRVEADTLLKIIDKCEEGAASVLREQAAISIARADSLYSCKETASALKSLDIAVSLIEKARGRCRGK